MTFPIGTEVYDVDCDPVLARGASLTQKELDGAAKDQLAAIVWDETGRAEARTLLAKAAKTEFEVTGIEKVLAKRRVPKSEAWRVGEAIAEAHLVAHRKCSFPWPAGRDLKNPKSSPAGTDLVGFQKDGPTHRLAFAEVKTSEDSNAPPGVLYGRHGHLKQLKGLRTGRKVKDALVKYLTDHAKTASWKKTFIAAAQRYLRSTDDVAIFGVLVRDTDHNELDLKAEATSLANGCPAATAIELRAVYLPKGAISKLPALVNAHRGSSS